MDSESIFVSYSSKDKPFALEFVKELQRLGINVWIDQLGIQLGENWDNAIEEALEKSNTFLLFMSPTAVTSQNVQDEVHIAIERKKRLVPVLIQQCDIPMRWQRFQYADLTKNPNKGLQRIMEFLGIEKTANQKLKEILSLIGVSEAVETEAANTTKENESNTIEEQEADLLISETEIDCATVIHQKGIKQNRRLIFFVAILSVVLAALLSFLNLEIQKWSVITGCLSINLLSIRPLGGIKKRERKIDLMDLLKLKRERLIRVVNKLDDGEISLFNEEFTNYITI
ncbi:MAG: toll/interleukin-1 receptor domain-containing protein [Bacteroidota bacterium]